MAAFRAQEHLARIAKVKARMRERWIDVLLVTASENLYYFTGYDAWSFYVHQMGIVALDADEPILVLRDQDTPCAEFTAFVAPENVIGYPERFIGDRALHVMSFIADLLRERAWDAGTVGVEMDSHFFTARCYQQLTSELVDADLLVNWVWTVKSAAEIAYMRQAGVIAGLAMAAAREHIRPGVRECDAAARVMDAMIEGTPEFGGDLPPAGEFLMSPGEKATEPHLVWTDAPFAIDVAVNVELGGCRKRYNAGLARTLHLGTPPAELLALQNVVNDGMETALSAVRPGVTAESIEAAWRREISKAGYDTTSRIGYSIELACATTWIDRTVSLKQGDTTVLESGMTFHMICGRWKGAHNLEFSETFRVPETGHELLTDFPRQILTADA